MLELGADGSRLGQSSSVEELGFGSPVQQGQVRLFPVSGCGGGGSRLQSQQELHCLGTG